MGVRLPDSPLERLSSVLLSFSDKLARTQNDQKNVKKIKSRYLAEYATYCEHWTGTVWHEHSVSKRPIRTPPRPELPSQSERSLKRPIRTPGCPGPSPLYSRLVGTRAPHGIDSVICDIYLSKYCNNTSGYQYKWMSLHTVVLSWLKPVKAKIME